MNLVGQTIGEYQIEAEIGRGGTSIVYQAIDLRDKKTVALKVMLPELIDNEMALRRFLREGKGASQLNHPNIVQVYEAGQADSHYYIAMEYISSGTLSDHIKQKGELLESEQIVAILSQIAAALDHAHSQGIIHRDLKLSNILLANDNRALLSDFGIAKHLFSEQTMVTSVGRAVGTPSFMSPEQITGESEIDYRSDIYSLGVIAYVLFTGRTPFTGDTTPQLLYKIAYDLPVSPEIINPELSPDIAAVLLRALAKDPGDRYKSAQRFVTSLSACQSYECEVISRKKPVKQTQWVQKIRPNWSFQLQIPTEAWLGAMISILVLIVVLSPSLDVAPKFLLTKLTELNIAQSVKLAFAGNQHTVVDPASANVETLSPSFATTEFNLTDLSQSSLESIKPLTKWDTFDRWLLEGYNGIVTNLGLEENSATPGYDTTIANARSVEYIPGPKPDLPLITPKLLR